MIKKVSKILAWIVGIVLSIFLLLWLLLQIPVVQNTIVDKITQQLSQTLDTKVAIDEVSLKFFKTVALRGIYVEDQQQDTLLYAQELSVNIGVFNLLNNEINLNQIGLQNALINLQRPENDTIYNYQFIIDAFASESPDTTTSTSAWTFGIDNIFIRQTDFRMQDAYAGTDLEVHIGDFNTTINNLNLNPLSLAINRISLSDSQVAYRILKDSGLAPDTTSTDEPLSFPDLGLALTVDKIRLHNNTIIYDDNTATPKPDAFDFAHIKLQNLEITADDLVWKKERIALDVQTIAFADQSGFKLDKLAAAIEVNPEQIQVQGFVVETPESSLYNSTTLTFNNFADLGRLSEDIGLQVTFDESKLAFQDLRYFAPAITEIKQLNTDLQQTINLSGNITGTLANLENIVIDLSVGNAVELQASGSVQHPTQPKQLRYDFTLNPLATSYDDLKRITQNVEIPTGLDSLGEFRLTGRFQGSLETLSGQNVRLTTESYTGLNGTLKLENLTNPDKLRFYLDVESLTTQASDLSGFSPNGLPPAVDSLGKINYKGKLSGTTQDFVAAGELNTDAGSAVLDASINFNTEFTDASYQGEVELTDFELGKILADTSFGNVSLAFAGSGTGLALDSLQAKIEGKIVEAKYQNYNYTDIQIDGQFDRKQFTGNANMDDPNLNFAFQGNVDLNDSIPNFQFTLGVDTVNLQQLNLYPEALGFSGDIAAKLSGNTIDNIDGQASIRNFAITNKTVSYQTDSIVLKAVELADTGRLVALQSEFLTARIQGDYSIAELPVLVQKFINDYFPIDQLMATAAPSDSTTVDTLPKDQNFEFAIELNQPVPFLKLFVPQLNLLDTAYIVGRLNSKARKLEIRSGVPKLEYQNITAENISWTADGTPQQLISKIGFANMKLTDSLRLTQVIADIRLGDDSLFFDLAADRAVPATDTSLRLLGFGGVATKTLDNYRLRLNEAFILNENAWSIPVTNQVLYHEDYLNIKNLALNYQEQQLAFNSSDEEADEDFAPLSVTFKNFELAEIFQLIGFSPDTYKGNISGDIVLRQIQKNLNYLVDVEVNDIILYNESLGSLYVEAEQSSRSSDIVIDSRLEGPRNDASVTGTYTLTDNSFDLQANLKRLELRIIDPFSQGYLQESEGLVSGDFSITGTTTTPAVNGTLLLNGISTTVGLTKVRYRLPQEEEVRITSTIVDLSTIELEDENNNQATLQGSIRHQNFTNIQMDMNFRTNRFVVLDTEAGDEELYYGKIVASGDVSIQGSPTLPRINVQAATLSPTQLIVQPLTAQEATARNENYVIFADPATYREDTTLILDDVYQLSESGIDLELNLEVTPDAELQIVIDPATGDKLVAKGDAELTVDMNPDGKISILGSYRIVEGQYAFNYQGLAKRNFEIRAGSRLEFIGDPLDTRFNITAVYSTRTPTYELIRNQVTSLSDQQVEQSKLRTPVNVVLRMTGDLNAPEISFDIQLPQAEGSPATSVVQQALARLRDNPSELNKQVFGLLLFNSFFSEAQSGGTLADAGSSIYLSSVSSLVSNQLNRLADKYVKGVDINVGVESYQSDYALENSGSTITELQLGLSKQFFDNRLTVRVGGNVNVNSENALLVEGANFSSIAGDFVLEYKLTENGNYRLRVFRKENYDALNQSNVARTGVSFFFKKSFKRKEKDKKKNSGEENETPKNKSAVRSGEQSSTIRQKD